VLVGLGESQPMLLSINVGYKSSGCGAHSLAISPLVAHSIQVTLLKLWIRKQGHFPVFTQ
jgi:hypothetical protein